MWENRFEIVGVTQQKKVGTQMRTCFSFVHFSLFGSNRQDIMIAQHVALSNVCEANLPLSVAKHCRMVQAQQGEKKPRSSATGAKGQF